MDGEVRIHEAGLVVKRGAERRLVPWSSVDGARLMPRGLVVERRSRFDLRCARSVIDDPEDVYEAIERKRTGGSRGGYEA